MAIETIAASKQTNKRQIIEVVCKDNNTKIVRLVVPVDVDGVDLSSLTWRINIKNSIGMTDIHNSHNVEISDSQIFVDWLIRGVATSKPGITEFQFEGMANNNLVWQTSKLYLRVKDRIDVIKDGNNYEEFTDLQQLIIYVNSELSNVVAAGEMARDAAQHPPVIGDNENWFVYDAEKKEYIDSGKTSKPNLNVEGVYFETDESLSLVNGVLSVNTASKSEQDNTLPITSAAVYTIVGNIEALLKTI